MNSLPKLIHYTTITDEDAYRMGFQEDDLGEFDRVADLRILDETLRSLGVEPHRLGFGRSLVRDLLELKPPLLWNLNSGVLGPTREAQVPALCEMMGIPLVGSGSWTAFITQDKTLTSDWISRNEIPVEIPKGLIIHNLTEVQKLNSLSFPTNYIVKPNNEDSSRGIERNALQSTYNGVRQQVLDTLAEWGSVRIEQYVEGFDISANLACQPDGTLFPLEPVMIESDIGIYTATMKNEVAEAPTKRRSALRSYDSRLSNHVQDVVREIATCLKFRHYARVDLRCELVSNRIFFLEANLCPNFEPSDDYVFGAELSGLTFPELLSNILTAAFKDAQNHLHLYEVPRKIRDIALREA